MSKNILFAMLLVLGMSGVAHAGGQAGSIGVGAEYQLGGLGGPFTFGGGPAALGGVSVNYDAGKFHVGGFLGYDDPQGANNTLFEIGARFFYHLHSTAMSDFGIGGGFGIASLPPMGGGMMPPPRTTDLFLEPGFQIRLFLASNVALSFTGGIVIATADASEVAITGQAEGIAGIHYYFF
jgi:hypothetical protein